MGAYAGGDMSVLIVHPTYNYRQYWGSFSDSGTIFLSGQSSLDISFSDGTPIDLGVGGGYFIMDKLAVGAAINFFSFDGNSDTNLGLLARYYVMDNLFGQASYTVTDPTLFAISAGYNWFLTDNVSFEPTFTYPFDDFADPSINVGVTIFLD